LMGPSSKSISLGTIQPIVVGLMGGKRCIAWTTQLWWTTMNWSFIWTSNTQGHTMTLVSFTNQTFINHDVGSLSTQMNILSTYWVTLVTWVKTCLWCAALGDVNWHLEFIWMLLKHTTRCVKICHFIPF
jgi:hypothetical protein